MSLPAQVQKQSEDIQELYRKLEAERNPAPETVENQEQEAPEEQVQAPTAAPAQSADNELDALTQRYRTLQGMYNADVPRLNAQNKELLARIANLENVLRNASQHQPAPAPAQPAPVQYLTEQDKAEYSDSIDVMRKVTREIVEPMRAGYEQRISELQGQLRQMQNTIVPKVNEIGRQQEVSSEQQFWATLSYHVPNWRDINDSADFQSWLLSQDPLTGISRQTYLDAAQNELDANRVIAFFVEWTAKTAPVAPTPNTRSPAAQTELEKQVSPGRGRTVEAPSQGNKKTFSGSQITQFFTDKANGVYRGREAEAAQIENDIFAATREGRVTK